MASKLAKLMRETMPSIVKAGSRVQVMTDLVGNFNNVVIEWEVASLAAFEKIISDYMKNANPKTKAKMAGYTDMYMTGRREIYRILG